MTSGPLLSGKPTKYSSCSGYFTSKRAVVLVLLLGLGFYKHYNASLLYTCELCNAPMVFHWALEAL